jgi:hypothetical protein
MHNPLAKKVYWDTDIGNAHNRIALHQCEELGLKCDLIRQYVQHRDDCLKMLSDSRKVAKTELLKTLCLGNMRLYDEHYNDDDQGMHFIAEPHKLKTGKDKKAVRTKPNPKASLMLLLGLEEERKMFMVWDAYLAVFIHNGGYVHKLEQEAVPPSSGTPATTSSSPRRASTTTGSHADRARASMPS